MRGGWGKPQGGMRSRPWWKMVATTPSRSRSTSWFQNSQHQKAEASKHLVPRRILQTTRIEAVLRTVDLDDEPCGQASEIGDVASFRHLPPEVQTLRLQATQMNPEFHLLRRHALAQTAGNLVRHGSAP